jgi:fermentation-respiration switch protein FrsA (DUF1100 family)
MLVNQRFDNLSRIEKVRCPIFFIHGMKDSLVPYTQSNELYEKVNVPTEFFIPKNMDHMVFDFTKHVTEPLLNFLHKINFKIEGNKRFRMPGFLMKSPKVI